MFDPKACSIVLVLAGSLVTTGRLSAQQPLPVYPRPADASFGLGSAPGRAWPVHGGPCAPQTVAARDCADVAGTADCVGPYPDGCSPRAGLWGWLGGPAKWLRGGPGDGHPCDEDANCCGFLGTCVKDCHRKLYFTWQRHGRHFLYPVCPPYHAPNHGYFPTCWRPSPPLYYECAPVFPPAFPAAWEQPATPAPEPAPPGSEQAPEMSPPPEQFEPPPPAAVEGPVSEEREFFTPYLMQ